MHEDDDNGQQDPQDLESDDDAERNVDDVLDIIQCLHDLKDNLQYPVEDWEKSEIPAQELKMYANLAGMMFPHAPTFLKERLIAASAKRRQRLKLLLGDEAHDRKRFGPALDIPRDQQNKKPRSFGFRRFKRGFAASDAGRSNAMSTFVESIFSTGAYQSTTGDMSIDSWPEELRASIKVPKIPGELQRGRSCLCRFCGFVLPFASHHEEEEEVRLTVDEWEKHVYQDLQPYMCTFSNCQQAQQSFGLKNDWFRHETFEHRSEEVWRCGGHECHLVFNSQLAFETHLRETHSDLLRLAELETLAQEFKHLEVPASQTQLCAICNAKLHNIQDLKTHIGEHMEHFALASMQIMNDASSDDEDDEEPHYAEEQPLWGVREFLFDQGEMNSPDSYHRPSRPDPGYLRPDWNTLKTQMSPKNGGRGNTGVSDADVASDSSISDDVEGADPEDERVQTIKFQERQNRVQSFLDKRPAESQLSETLDMTTWSNIPDRNTDFVGREADLRRVHDVLATPGQLCILSGRGGVGKTSSAVEYCFQYEKHYRYIFYVVSQQGILE